jgi:hypothetical protein
MTVVREFGRVNPDIPDAFTIFKHDGVTINDSHNGANSYRFGARPALFGPEFGCSNDALERMARVALPDESKDKERNNERGK